jgi:hypothetical protein
MNKDLDIETIQAYFQSFNIKKIDSLNTLDILDKKNFSLNTNFEEYIAKSITNFENKLKNQFKIDDKFNFYINFESNELFSIKLSYIPSMELGTFTESFTKVRRLIFNNTTNELFEKDLFEYDIKEIFKILSKYIKQNVPELLVDNKVHKELLLVYIIYQRNIAKEIVRLINVSKLDPQLLFSNILCNLNGFNFTFIYSIYYAETANIKEYFKKFNDLYFTFFTTITKIEKKYGTTISKIIENSTSSN